MYRLGRSKGTAAIHASVVVVLLPSAFAVATDCWFCLLNRTVGVCKLWFAGGVGDAFRCKRSPCGEKGGGRHVTLVGQVAHGP